ncbi:hypothetical protein MJO29_001548 [Puccinia striiformis f. sp. tritici]|nr:hypothetical protein MJO29_001548 [Puccinia striiformis f. sp. tritici]
MSNDIAVQRFKAKEQSLPSHRAVGPFFHQLLTTTSFLLIYVVVLFILSSLKINNVNESSGYHPPCTTIGNKSNPTPPVRQHLRTNPSRRKIWLQSWARHRLSFIKTPFGVCSFSALYILFSQVVISIMHFWVANVDCRSPSCQTTCTIQGVLIQIGDSVLGDSFDIIPKQKKDTILIGISFFFVLSGQSLGIDQTMKIRKLTQLEI